MGTTRARLGEQLEKSTTAASVLYTDVANKVSYLAPDIAGAADHLYFFDFSALTFDKLYLGAGLSISGNTLNGTAVAPWKTGVVAATIGNGTLATAFVNGSVIDGITLITGDRILLKNQTTASENGIRVVQVSGAPTRATDNDIWSEMISAAVIVERGTVNADTGWICTANTGGTIDVTANNWFKAFSVAGAIDGVGTASKLAYWSDADTLTSDNLLHYDGTTHGLGINTSSLVAGASLTVKGSGTTSATFSTVFQNSAGTNVLKIQDNGSILFGSATSLTVDSTGLSRNGSITIAPGPNTVVDILNGGGGGFLQFGNGFTWATINNEQTPMLSNPNYAVSGAGDGSGKFANIKLAPTINQTSGHVGITRGLYIVPTLIAAADFRGIEITANSSHYALYTTAGKVRHDLGSDATSDMWYRNSAGNMTRITTAPTVGQVLGTAVVGPDIIPTWVTGGVAGNIYTTDGVIPANTVRTVGLGNAASVLKFKDVALNTMLEFGDGYIEFGAGNITASTTTSTMGSGGGVLSFGATTIGLSISAPTTSAKITDNRATKKGLEYNADYSASYTARSLVDKGYVDTAVGGVVPLATRAFIENSTLTTIDLDANVGNVKDVSGANVAFTIPTDTDKLWVTRNGITQYEGASRDYTINTGTNEITFAVPLITTESVQLQKMN